jgi:hypothetical protein
LRSACTVQIVLGGAFERGRILPLLVFGFCWATLIYCPIACWTWNSNGWLYNLPSLNFAGGGPVHVSSGWSAFAYVFVLGKRNHAGDKSHGKPHNTTLSFSGLFSSVSGGLVSMWRRSNGYNPCNACCFQHQHCCLDRCDWVGHGGLHQVREEI